MEVSSTSQMINVQTINNSYSQTKPENEKPEDRVGQTEKPAEQMEKFHNEVKEASEEKQKEIQPDDTTKATMLNQAMTHNVVQNIPTTEIMKLMGNK